MNIKLSDHFTYKKLLRFCLSPIIMMVFTSIYGVVDGLFVSNYVGKTAFAAINLVMPFIMIFGGIGFMFGTGGGALIAKTMGQGDRERANDIFSMIVYVSAAIGVVLAVDSKNDEANALAGLNHPDSVLHPDDFVCIKANWDPKDQNLKAIAAELSLGADSFVFADDNPAERAIVAAQLPGVATPVLDGAENYIKMLDHGGYFEVTALSKEDLKKTELYHQNAERAKAQAAFTDYGQYLDSLEMTATIRGFEPLYIQRIAQLTNKSNQFNLTTLRCTEDDIRSMAEKPDWITLYGKLVDKFADNGVVTVVAGQAQGQTLCLRLWLMSCRVLKRGMEDAMMDTLAAKAAAAGYTALEGYYYPTAKNAMVREFYAGYGFEKTAEDADGNTTWRLDLAAYKPRCPHMKIET